MLLRILWLGFESIHLQRRCQSWQLKLEHRCLFPDLGLQLPEDWHCSSSKC